MRKTIVCLLLVMVVLCFSAPALANSPAVNLRINGQPAYPEAPPFIQDGYTMVPLRFIGNSCGMTVDWDADLRRVIVIGEANALRLDIGSEIAYVNGEPVQLQVPPIISGGYTMVPLRFVMENMDALVEWDAATRTVSITLAPSAAGENLLDIPAEYPVTALTRTSRVSGYYFDKTSWDMLSAHYNDFDTVINFAYKVLADGSIVSKNYNSGWAANAEPLLTKQGIEKLLLLTDFGDPASGKGEGSSQMLANSATRAVAVANIAALAEQTGADGVDIDFEKLVVGDRDNFTAFIRELKAALGAKLVTVSLPPKLGDNETWLDKFDYAALGQAADRLHIMFYDQHHGNSEPGPLATPEWISQGLEYLLTLVPREKLHVMLGVYGRAFGGSTNGTSTYISRVEEIIGEYGAQQCRDEASGVPYLLYKDKNGNDMQLWYEDAESMGKKAALACEYGVGGVGVWRMGIVPEDIWQSIILNFLN